MGNVQTKDELPKQLTAWLADSLTDSIPELITHQSLILMVCNSLPNDIQIHAYDIKIQGYTISLGSVP